MKPEEAIITTVGWAETLQKRIAALEKRFDMLEAALLQQHAVNESVANTLEIILGVDNE